MLTTLRKQKRMLTKNFYYYEMGKKGGRPKNVQQGLNNERIKSTTSSTIQNLRQLSW